MKRLRVGLLGATGVAGHQALVALARHPWFELVLVAGSPASAGQRLRQRLAEQGEAGSALLTALPSDMTDLRLVDADATDLTLVDLVFSMLPSSAARRLEPEVARTTPVISTASVFRDEPDTPLLLAGVNPDHAALLARQARGRGWRGFVAPGPNCTTVGLAVTLAPLVESFGVTSATLTSMQALSGAGSGAVALADAVDGNLLPFIAGEEEKVEREAGKILGKLGRGGLRPAAFPVSATCTRVGVEHGHTLMLNVGLRKQASPEEVIALWERTDPWKGRDLPSAPERWIEVRRQDDRPQPRLDRDAGGGMTTVVGRVRADPVSGGLKYVVVSHNAVLGAAGGAVLLAEDLLDRGLLGT